MENSETKKIKVTQEKEVKTKVEGTRQVGEKTQTEKDGKERVKEGKNYPAKPIALIIGASSGIGEELALGLLTRGYTVVNISRGECKNERVKNVKADVSKGEELEKAIAKVGEEYKRISLLIYSAGFSMAAPLEYAKEADIRYLFEVNYFGALRAVRSVLPFMKKTGGKVFLIGSMASSFAIPFDSFYSSSKAALDMLVKSVRAELKQYQISLTYVQPGGTATSFTFKRKIYADEENKEYAKPVHKATAALANIEQGGMTAGEVAQEIIKETMKKNPAVTLQTGNKNKAYRLAERYLPEKITEFFRDKKYNL